MARWWWLFGCRSYLLSSLGVIKISHKFPTAPTRHHPLYIQLGRDTARPKLVPSPPRFFWFHHSEKKETNTTLSSVFEAYKTKGARFHKRKRLSHSPLLCTSCGSASVAVRQFGRELQGHHHFYETFQRVRWWCSCFFSFSFFTRDRVESVWFWVETIHIDVEWSDEFGEPTRLTFFLVRRTGSLLLTTIIVRRAKVPAGLVHQLRPLNFFSPDSLFPACNVQVLCQFGFYPSPHTPPSAFPSTGKAILNI